MQISRLNVYGRVTAVLLGAVCAASHAQGLGDADKAAIEQLSARYLSALNGCKAEEFADLFVPGSGQFVAGFRGRMIGREKLILLVQSERHCTGEQPARAGGGNPPAVEIQATKFGALGVVKLGGAAEYEDAYVKTANGWRIGARTVIVAAEKAAGIDAREMLALQRLSADRSGDYYEADPKGVSRLLTSGTRITVKDGEVTGRVFLKTGGYDDEVYEKTGPGQWRVKSSTHVAAAAR
jgi:hypothetical protein